MSLIFLVVDGGKRVKGRVYIDKKKSKRVSEKLIVVYLILISRKSIED